MEGLRSTWGRMSRGRRFAAVAMPVVALVATAGVVFGAFGSALLSPAPEPTPPPFPGPVAAVTPSPLPPEESIDPSASPEPTPTPEPTGADPLLGTDGRFTVLLLGSDYRPAHPGNRTDAIMVVSVDPRSGEAAGFSIPRDTVAFPLAGGGVYGPKVNGLYQHLQTATGNGGAAMSAAMAKAFGIEIDGYAFIGFAGVKQLVGAVGGVDVTLDQPYHDPEYWVNARHQGWGLPAGTSHLGPNDALIFARSRKGDNDFGRARRQQMLVLAALDKVRKSGPAKLPQLLRIAQDTVRTNLPLAQAADLFTLVSTTNIAKVDRVVFGPRTFATGQGGTSFSLKLAACRAWIKAHFPPARPMARWPAPSAVPSTGSGSVAPSSAASSTAPAAGASSDITD
jgi:polyisoprenyl-teichoic acid--peptidoglycan teichoic acid transferase